MNAALVQDSTVQRLLAFAAAVQEVVEAANGRVTAPREGAETADERAAVVLDLLQHDLMGVLLDTCGDAAAVEEFGRGVALLVRAKREGLTWDLAPDLFGDGAVGGMSIVTAACAAGGVR
ncbi:MAG: hypothetical protein U0X20_21960 [Caldilineaceae bacterium]